MSTQVLNFATGQVSGLTTTQVAGMTAAQMSNMNLTQADLATIDSGIVDDDKILSQAKGPSAAALRPGITVTATTTKLSATMSSVTILTPSTAPIGAIQPGMFVSGVGLSPGTRVKSISGTTITLDRNAVATPSAAQGNTFVISQGPMFGQLSNGWLTYPGGRGALRVFPTDVIALDIMGFCYLIPATSIGSSGSGLPWILT